MFASNNDALSHLDSQVLSWMSLDVTREDLLHKINKVLKEYAASCCNLFQEYEFISVEKLKESKDVYKSSMQLSDANIGASCLKGIYQDTILEEMKIVCPSQFDCYFPGKHELIFQWFHPGKICRFGS